MTKRGGPSCTALVLMLLITASFITITFHINQTALALRYGKNVNISGVDASYWGERGGTMAGDSVAISDVNGDGFADIIVGVAMDDEFGTQAGQVYIVFGKATGWSMDNNLTNADASFYGERAQDRAGERVAAAGDVNGDGYGDFLVGAMRNKDGGNTSGAAAGQVYLIMGKASGWARDVNISAAATASFWGENITDLLGEAIAGAGDANGDTYDDIIIGTRYNSEVGLNAGKAYIVFGKPTGWAMDQNISAAASASFKGEATGNFFGWAVSGIGDFNGDGFDDVAVGAPYATDTVGGSGTNAGEVYVVNGRNTIWPKNVNISTAASASFFGESAGEWTGIGLARAGDVNADGFGDIIIGSPNNVSAGAMAGRVDIVFGRASGWTTHTKLSNSNASYIAERYLNTIGSIVAGAGDVDGDGFDDVLIGNNYLWAGQNNGWAYLIRGRTTGWLKGSSLVNSDMYFKGEIVGDYLGYGIAGGGDINGDGYDDIVVSDTYSDYNGLWGNQSGQIYIVFPDNNTQPSTLERLRACSDPAYTLNMPKGWVNDTVYVEINGTDGKPTWRDMAIVNISSDAPAAVGFRMGLMETGLNTGIYRGSFTIASRTDADQRLIKAVVGGKVTVTSTKDVTKKAIISIIDTVALLPLEDNLTATEDSLYSQHYWSIHPSSEFATWKFQTNATWLLFDPPHKNITGTPNNAHVGSAWVNISVLDPVKPSFVDWRNFTITIVNAPPEINSTDIIIAWEMEPYSMDYNCTDDGQGTITWHLATNAGPWLTINSTTGVLSGTPPAGSAGAYDVNISVDDGNGGWAWRNITLTVTFTHRDPVISTNDVTSTLEDMQYAVHYECLNESMTAGLRWLMDTNATRWLSLNSSTGVLSGIPTNEDVGIYWVNITAKDMFNVSDSHNFTLTVINVNDLPEITSVPPSRATAQLKYTYQVEAEDVDRDDVLFFGLQVAPQNMTIDNAAGLVEWVPSIDDEGQRPVIITVDDGHGTLVSQAFAITVSVPSSYAPEVMLLTPPKDTFIAVTTPALSWDVVDPDSDTVFFDVFLSKVEQDIIDQLPAARIAEEQLVQTLYIPPDMLEQGMTYYWTVIPNDGSNKGVCLSGVWGFTVSADAVPDIGAKTVLNAPSDGRTLQEFPVQLKWSGAAFGNPKITYDIYLSDDPGLVMTQGEGARILEKGENTSLLVSKLTRGTTYYWTVIPSVGGEPGECLSGMWSFKVAEGAVEDKPPIITSMPPLVVVLGTTYQYQMNASDPDAGDKLSFTLIKRPQGMIIDTSQGLIIWVPTKDHLGNHSVTVRVSDGRIFVEQAFIIQVVEKGEVNMPPSITSTPPLEVEQGKTYSYQVTATDIDIGDRLTFSLAIKPENMSISSSGLITWTPAKAQVGDHTVSIMVSDGWNVAYQNFTLEVKDGSVTPPDGDGTTGASNLPFPYWVLLLVIAGIAAIVGGVLYTKKRRDEADERERKDLLDVERERTKAMVAAAASAVKASSAAVPIAADDSVEDFDISEVFVVYHDGRLITHASTEQGGHFDKQLLSSMLVAIQIFVKESFKGESGLDSFEFSGRKVVLGGGRYLVIAAVVEGQEPAILRDEMQSVVATIEGMYAGVIEKWDGDNEPFKDAKRYLMPLFNLKSKLKIRKKATSVKLKSGVEFYSGYVRLKVGVSNELDGPINNIKLVLEYDDLSLRLSHVDPSYPMEGKTINLVTVDPKEKRSVAIYFDPLICQESHIDGHITYTDPEGNPGKAVMKRRPVDIVCPIFYTKETVNVAMMKRLLGDLDYKDSRIYAARSLKALQAAYDEAVGCVKGHDVKFVREFKEPRPFEVETWFYGEVRETDEQIVIRVAARESWQYLEVFVATKNLASMTGLLAELGNEFAKRMQGLGMLDALVIPHADDKIREEIGKTRLLLDKYADMEMAPATEGETNIGGQ